MDGIHDLGGRVGYGPVDVHEPEEQFHHAWEARSLAIIRAFTRPEPWSLDWFRQVRELIEPADYLGRPYYDQWLQSYAAMAVHSGAATVEEIVSGRSERRMPGLPPPMSPSDVARSAKTFPDFRRSVSTPPRFAAGAKVRTHRDGSVGHTRLPQYARGRDGRIHLYRGGFVLPDRNERDDGPGDHLYTVAFAAGELWPEAKGRPDTVFIDLWESYLEPA
ncbi:MAG TPA: nitrile hydratase subunit beta [Bauldia sp.]|nr:nitrile hydratase subunit beta [Bauldia sp.]